MGREGGRFVDPARSGGGCPHAGQATSLPGRGSDDFVEGWKKSRASEHVRTFTQGHERAPKWNVPNERLRAIDGINDPPSRGAWPQLSVLLAENAIIGKTSVHPLPCRAFRSAIRVGHGRSVALCLHADARAEMSHGDFSRNTRQVHHRFQREAIHSTIHERTSSPAAPMTRLTSATVVSRPCRMPATNAASAPCCSTSHTCSADPAPPDAMTGTFTAADTASAHSTS